LIIQRIIVNVLLPSTWFKSGAWYMRQKYILINFYNKQGVKSMLLTKNTIKFNNLFVKIPRQTKRVWDLAENRWGYKPQKKDF